MDVQTTQIPSKAVKLTINKTIDGKSMEVARAFVFLITNDLHEEPYGLLEDVYVNEEFRGQGLGKQITQKAIDTAKGLGCYKFICTSRYAKPHVHELYQKLGFKDHGKEFRMDFN